MSICTWAEGRSACQAVSLLREKKLDSGLVDEVLGHNQNDECLNLGTRDLIVGFIDIAPADSPKPFLVTPCIVALLHEKPQVLAQYILAMQEILILKSEIPFVLDINTIRKLLK